jgi:hypothetical protein
MPYAWRSSGLRDDREFDPFIEAFSQAAGFNRAFSYLGIGQRGAQGMLLP